MPSRSCGIVLVVMRCAMICCHVLCCAVLCCAVLCWGLLCAVERSCELLSDVLDRLDLRAVSWLLGELGRAGALCSWLQIKMNPQEED